MDSHSLGSAGSPPPLETSRLTKQFRQGGRVVTALDDLSLRVEQGEFVAVMGASGSGKSTLLHLAAGLTDATSGAVSVEGHDLAAMSDRRLTHFRRCRIGLVFQSLNLAPALTAEENVLLPLHAASERGPRLEAAGALLDRLGLADRRTHRPAVLSGGEQQRVAIARALVTDPAIVLADEPTGSLDSTNAQRICELLRQLNEDEGRTLVVVTHEPTVAVWADRIVVLKDGRLQTQFAASQFDNAQELAAHYLDITSTRTQPELTHGRS